MGLLLLGFTAKVVLVDILLVLLGICLGVVFISFRLAHGLRHIFIVPETRKTKANIVVVRDDNGREPAVYLNPVTPAQTLEAMWQYNQIKRSKHRDFDNITYIKSSPKRARNLVLATSGFALTIFLIALAFICDIQHP